MYQLLNNICCSIEFTAYHFDISLQNSEQRKEILNIILEKEKVDHDLILDEFSKIEVIHSYVGNCFQAVQSEMEYRNVGVMFLIWVWNFLVNWLVVYEFLE